LRWYFVLCGLIGLAVAVAALVELGSQIWVLVVRRRLATKASPRTPDLDSPDDEPVDWWEMHRAGFEATVYQESLAGHELRLRGKPWKVLRNHDVVIPVFRRRGSQRLYRQHYARIAAYCQLIEECEGVTSPYGLILEAGTYRAIAVKNTPAAKQALHTVLQRAQSLIRDYAETGVEPPEPERHGFCSNCPIGFPRLYVPGETELVNDGKRLPIVPAFSTRRGHYHSKCGDRFRWTPAHDRVERRKIWGRW
jgi:CRISPR/Cas system-associated exonuclease Cas4 (RecB family)